ncbi:aldo/keto reductase [Martelella endophytica]|uniref:Aldo/keto reductase n=1 Tax=Martelella endophytica TaxID=1486262 RepID=A0A0D5LXA8_MAREN|nr:aldo/keto reductase [Martelella endophytica]AJY48068.1 aldo/keto reductase [Martelella endophytica]
MKSINGIPQMGFGTWKRRDDECYRTVLAALEAGYRHIDTAQAYGNEESVGRALADSGLGDDDVFVTTKVWIDNYGDDAFRPSVEESLKKLGRNKVDLLLLHWPGRKGGPAMEDYVGRLAAVYDDGLAARIGVSNFTTALMDEAAKLLGDRPISANQVECHVFHQNRVIADYCKEHGIAMTAYSPLAQGKIAGEPVLKEIGAAHGVSEGEIALAFLLAEGHVVIPTSSKPERVKSNLAAAEITLTAEEIDRLRDLDRNMRLISPEWAPDWD